MGFWFTSEAGFPVAAHLPQHVELAAIDAGQLQPHSEALVHEGYAIQQPLPDLQGKSRSRRKSRGNAGRQGWQALRHAVAHFFPADCPMALLHRLVLVKTAQRQADLKLLDSAVQMTRTLEKMAQT